MRCKCEDGRTEYYKLPGSDPKYREETPVVRQPIITAV